MQNNVIPEFYYQHAVYIQLLLWNQRKQATHIYAYVYSGTSL